MYDLFFHPGDAYVQAGAFPYKQEASAYPLPDGCHYSNQTEVESPDFLNPHSIKHSKNDKIKQKSHI